MNNAYLRLARNATLSTNLDANNSVIALGDNKVFIDTKDGKGSAFSLEEGSSVAEKESDKSIFNGHAMLKDDTELNILNAVFNGTITGDGSSSVQLDRRGKWNIAGDSSLGKFVSHGGSLSMLGSDWNPKTLRINEMDATDMHISLGADVSKGIGDRIEIIERAQGQNNILDVSLFFDENARLKNDLTVVSAPAGTAHNMFSFGSFTRGFSDFTPETQVQEADGKVMWQLAKVVSSSEEENTPEPEKVVTDDSSESTAPPVEKETESGKEDAKPNLQNEGLTFSGSDSFTKKNSEKTQETTVDSALTRHSNMALLNKARDTFISHEYILSDRVDRWQQVVDGTTANGAWALTEQSYGKHGDFTLSQSGLNIGFKKSNDAGSWWGVGADLNRGQAKADYYRNGYNLWAVNAYVRQQLMEGLFVDGAAGFGQLTEDFKVHGELRDLSGKVKSHVFTGGLRVGYKFNFENADFSITPTVSLNGIKVSDSRLKGKGRRAELRGGDALWLKTGVEAEKKIKDVKLKAGVWRNNNLNEMSGISLSDNWSQHQYKSKNLERITSSVEVEGKATENLHIKAGVNAKFDGYFKNNYEGIVGIRYEF